MSNDPFNHHHHHSHHQQNFHRGLLLSSPTITSGGGGTAVVCTPTTTNTTVASSSSSSSNNKDAEDLHAWSLFRQNLNANFSESVLSDNNNSVPQKSSKMNGHTGTGAPNGQTNQNSTATGFALRESTVNNILSHPKYGAQLKNQDAFTYLRFGLPRVKAITNSNGDRQPINSNLNKNYPDEPRPKTANNHHHNQQQQQKKTTANGARPGVGSAAINEELKRRFWGSDSNLLGRSTNSENDSDSSGKEPLTGSNHHNNRHNDDRHQQQKTTHNFNNRYNPQPPPTTQHSKPMMKSHLTRSSHNINSELPVVRQPRNSSPTHNHHQHHHSSPHHSDDPEGLHQARISPMFHHHHHHHHHAHNGTDHEDDPIDDLMNLDDDGAFTSGATNGGGQNGTSSSSLPPPLAKHPHLVVKDLMYEVDKSSNWRRLCGFSRQKLRILEDISFDVRGGELLAIVSTSAHEGTALLNVLGARHDHRNGTARAEIYLNGILVSAKHLSRMMAYVTQQMHLCSDMSARQALLFAGLLMGPASRSSTDVKRLTRTLLEELNLGEVRHTKLSELTHSERRRLHIAMHLLLDTELLMIDQPLLGLDIFDSFFMVEYLRQWAMVGGRAVIMTISPPTYEVFTMIHRVLLISAGRPLYVGPRRDFLKYFTSLGYPCPPFKNPSDYYLDLVTLDDLSQEALLESSQRIETLADMHTRRSISEIFSSMPGPPAVLPAPFRRANFAMQFLALWIRALIFSFPYNVVQLFNRFMVTLLLSLMIGAIYWQVRTGHEQEFVWDRIGFINTMLSIGIVPILAIELVNAYWEKKYILSEVYQGFYSLPAYLLAKLLYSTPQTILIGLAYALPACSMAGLQLHSNPNSLPYYLLLMLSYFMALRSFVMASVWICSKRSTASLLFGLIYTIFLLSSGMNIQYRDISITHRWLRQISPIRWIHEAMIAWEFEPNVISNNDGSIVSSFLCSRNPVIQQPNAILVRADCGFQTRANILKWFEYQGGNVFQTNLRPSWHAFIALLILYLGSFIFGSIIFCLRVYYYHECPDQHKQQNDGSNNSNGAKDSLAAANTIGRHR